MSNNYEIQDQNLHLTTSNQMFELDDNELDNIAGGGKHRKPDNSKLSKVKGGVRAAGRVFKPLGYGIIAYDTIKSAFNDE